ncbi:MAG: PAS domain-containing protein [Coriobacteriia bacterium]|nr:PAS domain-containing protein [Coriobacteriia bacterium]
MSAPWSVLEDVLPVLAYTLALVAVLRVPARPSGPVSSGAKWFFAASIFCYLVGTGASIFKHLEVFPDVLEPVVSSFELLWIPFVLFGVYSLYLRQQYNETQASARALVQTGELMEDILETTPAGIIVLSDAGHITFANKEARGLLDLDEAAATSTLHSLDFVVRYGDNGTHQDFSELVGREPLEGQRVVVEWPSGWRRELKVNTAPFLAEDGSVAGAVASFVATN